MHSCTYGRRRKKKLPNICSVLSATVLCRSASVIIHAKRSSLHDLCLYSIPFHRTLSCFIYITFCSSLHFVTTLLLIETTFFILTVDKTHLHYRYMYSRSSFLI